MNRQFRTVALAAASLGLLLSLFLALRPGGDDERAVTTTTVATTTAPATTAPKPLEVVTIRIAVQSDKAPTARRYSVQQGQEVEIVVESEIADEVHLHGYDVTADVAPGRPVMIAFTATAPGRFELELERRQLAIAELEVRP